MNYSLNSFKWEYVDVAWWIRFITGDTRSLDNSSYNVSYWGMVYKMGQDFLHPNPKP